MTEWTVHRKGERLATTVEADDITFSGGVAVFYERTDDGRKFVEAHSEFAKIE